MTKYEQLSEAAVKWSKQYYESHTLCTQTASLVRKEYANFLNAPLSNIAFFELDLDLNRVSNKKHSAPVLRWNLDGMFYFGLVVGYSKGDTGANEYIPIGVARKSDRMVYVTRGGQSFESDFGKPPVALFEHLFRKAVEQYSHALTGAKGDIGFISPHVVPTNQNKPVDE